MNLLRVNLVQQQIIHFKLELKQLKSLFLKIRLFLILNYIAHKDYN